MDTKFDKSVSNNESGVLAKLWRQIISENNLLPQIGMLINKYLDEDETNQRVQAYKKKNRSTLTENIFASEMSIKVFLYLIFKVLRAKKIDISIKVTFSSGRESMHNVSVDGSCAGGGLGDFDPIESESKPNKKSKKEKT